MDGEIRFIGVETSRTVATDTAVTTLTARGHVITAAGIKRRATWRAQIDAKSSEECTTGCLWCLTTVGARGTRVTDRRAVRLLLTLLRG